MYDKLIKRLRDAARWADKGLVITPNVCLEAADAIEELNQYAENIKKLKCEGWYLQQNKYHDGYQAVATMPFPEPPKEEI